jgi:hypothetical protein
MRDLTALSDGVFTSIFIGISGNVLKTYSRVGIDSPFDLTVVPSGAKFSSISSLNGGRSLKSTSLINFFTPHVL